MNKWIDIFLVCNLKFKISIKLFFFSQQRTFVNYEKKYFIDPLFRNVLMNSASRSSETTRDVLWFCC